MKKDGASKFSTEFKTRVALEAIRGQRTANELAQEYGVHVNQISLGRSSFWKQRPKYSVKVRIMRLNG